MGPGEGRSRHCIGSGDGASPDRQRPVSVCVVERRDEFGPHGLGEHDVLNGFVIGPSSYFLLGLLNLFYDELSHQAWATVGMHVLSSMVASDS